MNLTRRAFGSRALGILGGAAALLGLGLPVLEQESPYVYGESLVTTLPPVMMELPEPVPATENVAPTFEQIKAAIPETANIAIEELENIQAALSRGETVVAKWNNYVDVIRSDGPSKRFLSSISGVRLWFDGADVIRLVR